MTYSFHGHSLNCEMSIGDSKHGKRRLATLEHCQCQWSSAYDFPIAHACLIVDVYGNTKCTRGGVRITHVSATACLGKRHHDACMPPFARFLSFLSPFLCLIFWPAPCPVIHSPSTHPPSCVSLPALRWPSLLPSRSLLPRSVMHTRPGGTTFTTLLVAILEKSISTSVLIMPGSPTLQSDLVLAARLASRVILCVFFVLACNLYSPSLALRWSR